MIAFGAIADAAGILHVVHRVHRQPGVRAVRRPRRRLRARQAHLGRERTDDAMSKGFDTTGQILLITGVGGSLGAVIAATDLEDVLGDLFSAEAGAPVIVSILLAWLIAAVLHLAIGSISVAAITAPGIIGPIIGGA